MGELAKRTITGAAFVALTLGAAKAGPLTITLLFLPVCALAVHEFHQLARARTTNPSPVALPIIIATCTFLAVAAAGFIPRWTPSMALAVILALFCIGAAGMLAHNSADLAKELGVLLAGMAYIALPLGSTTFFMDQGPWLLIGFFLLLWGNDTGAYLAGRAFGRTKLVPRISPKKTVEGLVGGVLAALLIGYLLALAWPVLAIGEWAACAVVVSLLATLGDLLESALKRAAGVKDSGHILPGHGGILDRFDGFLLSAPGMLLCVHLMR